EAMPADRLIGYGFDSPAAVLLGRSLELMPDGVRFTAEFDGERQEVELHVPGRHNAMNALAALGAAHALGISLGEAGPALARFGGLKRRLETVGTAGGVTV